VPLQDAGADLARIDALICNAGSEIWYGTMVADSTSAGSTSAGAGSSATCWREDLDYERHVQHCWDKAPLKRVGGRAGGWVGEWVSSGASLSQLPAGSPAPIWAAACPCHAWRPAAAASEQWLVGRPQVLAQALCQPNLFGASVTASVGAAAAAAAAGRAPAGKGRQQAQAPAAASPFAADAADAAPDASSSAAACEAVSRLLRAGSLHVTSGGAIGVVKRSESLAALGPAAGALHRVASGILPREDRPKIRIFPETGPHHLLVLMTKPPAAAAAAAAAAPAARQAADAVRAIGRADQQQQQQASRPPKPRPAGQAAGGRQPGRRSAFASAAVQTLAPAVADAPGAQQQAEAAAGAGASGGGTQQGGASLFDAFADVPALLARLRRKFRSCGIRANLTAEVSGTGGGGGSEALRLHLTPIRASRALAASYLALKLQVPLDGVTVLGFPTGASASGGSSDPKGEGASKAGGGSASGGARAAFCASDAQDWVAGLQQVALLPPPQGAGGLAAGAQGEPGQGRCFWVDLGAYAYEGRVRLLLSPQPAAGGSMS
jgi:hypothetical protein